MLMREATLRVRELGVRLCAGLGAGGKARFMGGLIASSTLAPSDVTDFIFSLFLLRMFVQCSCARFVNLNFFEPVDL